MQNQAATGTNLKSETATSVKAKTSILKNPFQKPGVKRIVQIGGGSLGLALVSAAMFPIFGAIIIFSLGVGSLVVIGALFHGYNVLEKSGVINPAKSILAKASRSEWFNKNIMSNSDNQTTSKEEKAA